MTASVSGHSIVAAAEGQISCDVAEEMAILDLQSGVYYGLNCVGSRIWQLIQQPTSVGEVRRTLLEEYDIEPECCERELLALLQDLAAKGLIEVK